MTETEGRQLSLSLEAGVDLAHALVQRVATLAHVRALFIKGPVANFHGIRSFRVPSDVDVLVHPVDVEPLIAELRKCGWEQRPESFAHRSFVTHSITLIHPSWPCDIDVHRSFPGFLADDEVAFEVLWKHRESVTVAASSIDGADFVSSVVIAALHALRAPYLARNREEFDQALNSLQARDDSPQLIEQIIDLAERGGAVRTLAPFLQALGVTAIDRAPLTEKYVEWQRNSRQLNRAASWLVAIQSSRWRDRPLYIWRAIFPAIEDLLIDHPSTPRTFFGIASTWFARGISAAKAMPTAIASLRYERRIRWGAGAVAWSSSQLSEDTLRESQVVEGSLIVSHPQEAVRGKLLAGPPSATKDVSYSRPEEGRGSDMSEVLPSSTSPNELVASSRVRRAPNVAEVHDLAGSFILPLRDPSNAIPHLVSGTGLTLWTIVQGKSSIADIIDEAASQYELVGDEVGEDVSTFLDALVELKILERIF